MAFLDVLTAKIVKLLAEYFMLEFFFWKKRKIEKGQMKLLKSERLKASQADTFPDQCCEIKPSHFCETF